MMTPEEIILNLAELVRSIEQRMESTDRLMDVLSRVLAEEWWTAGTDAKSAIQSFRDSVEEHRRLVASLHTSDSKIVEEFKQKFKR